MYSAKFYYSNYPVGFFIHLQNDFLRSKLHYLINYFLFTQQTRLGYAITQIPGSPMPTRRPFATQKKQNEWELGVLKGFLWWHIPVYNVFYQKSMQS